ncbi:hypothetical protein [Bradyrhizobium sp. LMG 9283]|uniref:hypothetical protein n=1 Tax=Bradyrhizobium sp. LMG 9283 TaxID=592064 RepID=UPI00388F4AA7
MPREKIEHRNKRALSGSKEIKTVVFEAKPGHRFRFPSTKAVKAVGADLGRTSTGSAQVRRVKNAYKSAGHEIMGATGDGVVIVRPSGKPDSFRLQSLKEAVGKVVTRKA